MSYLINYCTTVLATPKNRCNYIINPVLYFYRVNSYDMYALFLINSYKIMETIRSPIKITRRLELDHLE